MRTQTPEFKAINDHKPSQGRSITSVLQREYLTQRNPDLAANLEAHTSPTEFLPLRASKRRRK